MRTGSIRGRRTERVVGDLVGHNLKTMERHYKNIQLMNLESDIVNQRRKRLRDSDFQTSDIDLHRIVEATL